MTLSVALLIVVSSLFSGFIDTFEQAAVDAVGDVMIFPPAVFTKYDRFIENLEQSEIVQAAAPVLSGYGLLHVDIGNVRTVEILGIEPQRHTNVTNYESYLLNQNKSGNMPSFSIPDVSETIGGFVSIGLFGEPNEKTDEYDQQAALARIGDKITLTTGTASAAGQSNTNFKRKVVQFTIADIVESGVSEFDSSYVYLPIEDLQEVLYPDKSSPVADRIFIKLADNSDPNMAVGAIKETWDQFVNAELDSDPYLLLNTKIQTTKQAQRRIIAEFRKQMGVLLVIFGIISLGAIILIFCIFYMIVQTKQKDIAIIKSCGAADVSVASLFLGFGAFIGIIGAVLGTILGYIITININTIENWIRIIFGLKLWKSSVYLFNKIPNQVDWSWVLRFGILAIIAAAIGALIPAIVAAKTKPVNILRYE